MGIQAKATQVVTQLMSLNRLMWLTMLIFFAGILVLAAAAYQAMALALPPAIAALLTGVALLVVSALLAGLIRLAIQPASGKRSAQTAGPPAESRPDETREHTPRPDFNRRAVDWARENSDVATACAAAAGIALIASPGLRKFALRTAGPILARKVTQPVQDFTDRQS